MTSKFGFCVGVCSLRPGLASYCLAVMLLGRGVDPLPKNLQSHITTYIKVHALPPQLPLNGFQIGFGWVYVFGGRAFEVRAHGL